MEKVRLVLFNILDRNSCILPQSIITLDLLISRNLIEFSKVFSFFYIDYNLRYLQLGSVQSYNFLNYEEKSFFKSFSLDFQSRSERLIYFKIKLLIPIKYLLERFRSLGFVHFLKFCPIGNIRYLNYSDFLIVRSFGHFAFSILFWFRIANNFSSVKVLLEVLRNSCLLTLCRKHNKGKVWAFSVYTTNIIILKVFENSSCVRRLCLLKLNRTFIESDVLLYLVLNLNSSVVLGLCCLVNLI